MSALTSSQTMPSDTPDTSPGPAEETPLVELQANASEAVPAAVKDDDMDDVDDSAMSLPLSKIKRIFKMDADYNSASASAVYATGVATELFVQYLVEHASMLAKMDKRKKLQYKDFSNAVNAHDALYFLADTIPKTQAVEDALRQRKINVTEEDQETYADILGDEDLAETAEVPASPEKTNVPTLPKGQTTLPFEAVPKTVKKAGLHDLISNEESDAMAIDG